MVLMVRGADYKYFSVGILMLRIGWKSTQISLKRR